MKKLLLSSLFVAGFMATGFSQAKPLKPLLTAKIKTPNASCEDCKVRIESYLKRYDGITFVSVNFRTGITTVKYLTDRTDIEQIKTAISNAGYDADDVKAAPDMYNRLPKKCKKFEDGGGHPKPKAPPPPAEPVQ